MKRVHFHGPTHTLVVGDEVIAAGESALLPDDVAERLRKWEKVEVTVEDETKKGGK